MKGLNVEKTAVHTDQAPAAIGPYSQGIAVNNMLFLSGQLGIDPATGTMPESVTEQTELSLKSISAILAERGMTLDNVVRTTVLLADINDFAAVNEVYGKAFSEPYPVRCAYEVANLPAGGLVEIEVLATA